MIVALPGLFFYPLFYRSFKDLLGCLVENMGRGNLFCDRDYLKKQIVDKGVLREWLQGFDWNYYDSCEGMI